MAKKSDILAINGGEPIRKGELPSPYLGANLFGQEELDLLKEVIESKSPFRYYGVGTPHMVNDFEALAREYFNMPFSLATATGSSGLYCILAGLGLRPGDEIIIPSFGWFTNFEAPVLFGALPVFADIDRSLNMDPEDFKCKITPNTKAVIVIHFQGASNNMEALLEIAKERNITVIEDCAQACGADYKGKKLGSLGQSSYFSLQQNKIITTGDGGFILTKDPLMFEKAVRFHDLGHIRSPHKDFLSNKLQCKDFSGCQFRMNEFTGAVALAQLRKLDSKIIDVTRKYYWKLRNNLELKCEGIKFRKTGDLKGDAGIALFMDFESPEKAAWFKKALNAEGIREGATSGCCNLLRNEIVKKNMANIKMPPFGQGCYGEKMNYNPESCPNTDKIVGSMACVAISPLYSEQDLNDIESAIVKIWKNISSKL